jgi:hypothetical protein
VLDCIAEWGRTERSLRFPAATSLLMAAESGGRTRVRSRVWKLKPKIGFGDSKDGTVDNIVGLEQDGIKAYLPTPDFSQRTRFYPVEAFQYNQEQDLYRCPHGHELRLYSRRTREEVFVYRADAATCNACPLKAQCTSSQSGRHLFRSIYQEYLDRKQPVLPPPVPSAQHQAGSERNSKRGATNQAHRTPYKRSTVPSSERTSTRQATWHCWPYAL